MNILHLFQKLDKKKQKYAFACVWCLIAVLGGLAWNFYTLYTQWVDMNKTLTKRYEQLQKLRPAEPLPLEKNDDLTVQLQRCAELSDTTMYSLQMNANGPQDVTIEMGCTYAGLITFLSALHHALPLTRIEIPGITIGAGELSVQLRLTDQAQRTL